jgi:acyl carrier protein
VNKEKQMELTEQSVLEFIRTALADIKVPGAETAQPETTWQELDVDSLELVELVQRLEEHFEVTIHDGDLKPIATVGDAVTLTISLVQGAAV